MSSSEHSPGISFHSLRAENQRAYEEGLALLRDEVALSPEDKALWDALPKAGRTARAFQDAHRTEVVTMFLKYPSIERDGIRLHKGLERGELPFKKEFLMARLLRDILAAEGRKVRVMVLLPRYSGRMIKDVFSVDVAHSSTEDALTVSMEENGKRAAEYYEFKMGAERNLGNLINKAIASGSRFSLTAVDRFPKDTVRLLNRLTLGGHDHTAYVFSATDSKVRKIYLEGKKQDGPLNPSHSSRIEIPGGVESRTPSANLSYHGLTDASSLEIRYLDELRAVSRDAIIDYSEYLRDTGYVYSSEKGRRELEALIADGQGPQALTGDETLNCTADRL